MTLADVRDLIKTFCIADNHYIGKLDNKSDKSIGIYSLRRNKPVLAIGGFSTYDIKSISVLIHWNRNANETELTALELYKKIQNIKNIDFNGTTIYFVKMNVAEPVDVGTDNSGVYERVIEFDIYYKKKEN